MRASKSSAWLEAPSRERRRTTRGSAPRCARTRGTRKPNRRTFQKALEHEKNHLRVALLLLLRPIVAGAFSARGSGILIDMGMAWGWRKTLIGDFEFNGKWNSVKGGIELKKD